MSCSKGHAETITDDDKANISARIKVACTISWLIFSNSTNQSSQAITLYQKKNREAPFPLYLGLKLHSNDRQKENIRTLHALVISVSYDRVMEVRKQFSQAVCKRWQEYGVIVPINIKRKVFVATVVDNIDESSRHEPQGTVMSLTSSNVPFLKGATKLSFNVAFTGRPPTLYNVVRYSGPQDLYDQNVEKEVIQISKPEVLRVIDDFERNLNHSSVNNQKHQKSVEQTKFLKHLKALLNVVQNGTIVNSFKETGMELATLDTGEVMDPVVARCAKENQGDGRNHV
ncbi:hypothetical protein FQA39_LY17183 [Lamprigera yunnana]|nr:hypothetical protein FQA39_LY17183 [Lamprigera yunnana]